MTTDSGEDIKKIGALVEEESALVDRLTRAIAKVVVGQEAMIERLIIGMLCGGHCLIEGVPGLAKTLTVSTLAKCIGADFSRIQFTPDLLPADIIGTTIYNMHTGEFAKKKGPVFAHLILADEINRAPAKVQSALLEAMQERQVTIGDHTESLPDPFLVLATQNPIEQEGTYALPEAQLDRFMLMIRVEYPTRSEERDIMDKVTASAQVEPSAVTSIDEVQKLRSTVKKIYVDESIREYIINIVQATRFPTEFGLEQIAPLIEYGASPRASISLLEGARAHALLRHRGYVTPEDIKAIGLEVLRHRVVLTYEAEAEELSSDDVIRRIFETIEIP